MIFFNLIYFLILLSTVPAIEIAPSLWGWNIKEANAIYDPGLPKPRHYTTDTYSACGNGGHQRGPNLGFACPHMFLFSPDMMLAARYDGLNDDFYYAVGGAGDDHECGKCYQVQPLDPESINSKSLDEHQLIVQVINSGFDVMPGQFDIFMGAGGHGFFNACTRDCTTRLCAGGPCVQGLYNGTFDAWNTKTLDCYGGGLRLVHNSSQEIISACTRLSGGSREYKDKALWQSCIISNTLLYHQNFLSSKSINVQCPEGLSRLTGLKRSDESNLPLPHTHNHLVTLCSGNKTDHRFCISSMADCCMPSCAWNNKGKPDHTWNRVDTCREDGTVYNYV